MHLLLHLQVDPIASEIHALSEQHQNLLDLRQKGMEYLDANDAKMAELTFTSALKAWPTDISCLQGRGRAFARLKEWCKAGLDFKDVCSQHPEDYISLAGLGDVCYMMDRYEDSVDYYSRALQQRAGDCKCLSMRGAAYTKMAGSCSQEEMRMGVCRKAVSDLTAALSKRPNDMLSLHAVGLAYHGLEMWNACISNLNRVLDRDPQNKTALEYWAKALHNRACAQLKSEAWVAAAADATAAIDKLQHIAIANLPENLAFVRLWLLRLRGTAYAGMGGRWADAVIDFSAVLKFLPRDEPSLKGRDEAFSKLEKMWVKGFSL